MQPAICPAPEANVLQSLEVIRTTAEADGIVSVYLKPAANQPPAPFCAGQFLRLSVTQNSGSVAAECIYTISSRPGLDYYRITIKQDPSRSQSRCAGRFSRLQPGDTVDAAPPAGDFILHQPVGPVVVFLTAGVGITPAISMLEHIAAAALPLEVTTFHVDRSPATHAFRRDVQELAAHHNNIRSFAWYTRASGQCGRPPADYIKALLPRQTATFFVCGPPSFVAEMSALLVSSGVRNEHIRVESFGARVLNVARRDHGPAASGRIVSFAKSGISLKWDDTFDNLLDFAQAHGQEPRFLCRGGFCGTCRYRLIAGQVRYPNPPNFQIASGDVLLCSAVPETSVEVDL